VDRQRDKKTPGARARRGLNQQPSRPRPATIGWRKKYRRKKCLREKCLREIATKIARPSSSEIARDAARFLRQVAIAHER
jgi:hypothetical protein